MKKNIIIFVVFISIGLLFGLNFFYGQREKEKYMHTFFFPGSPNYGYIEGKRETIFFTGDFYNIPMFFLDGQDDPQKRKTVLGIFDQNGEKQNNLGNWSWSTMTIYTGNILNFDYKKSFWNSMSTKIVHHTGADLKICFLGRNKLNKPKEEKIMLKDATNCISVSSGKNLLLPKPKNDYSIINEQISSSGYAEFTRHLEKIEK